MTKHQLQDLFLRAPKGAEFVGISSLSGEPVYYRDIKEAGHYCCGSNGFDRGAWMYLPGIPSASPLYAMPSISNYIFSDRWAGMAWKVAENAVPAGCAGTAKCDGNHGGPRCADPECWNDIVDASFPEEEMPPACPVKPWTGEGLPPVGAKVILDDSEHSVFEGYREMIGVEVEVLTSFKAPFGLDMIACALPDGLCGCFRASMARPIRTPEQIAADHRLHEIRNAHSAIAETLKQYVRDIPGGAVARTVIEAMIDADYRKQVKP